MMALRMTSSLRAADAPDHARDIVECADRISVTALQPLKHATVSHTAAAASRSTAASRPLLHVCDSTRARDHPLAV